MKAEYENEYIHVYNISETVGRSFVVADIHGNYKEFFLCLDTIGFNFETDTIFSLGDIVDRGSDDISSMSLLKESWFKSIKGNHEAMHEVLFFENAWGNGTAWGSQIFCNESHPNRNEYFEFIENIKSLPYIFDINSNSGKRWVCAHAELPHMCRKKEDCSFESLMEDASVRYFPDVWPRTSNVLWGRSHYQYGVNYNQADWIFHGHTIFKDILIQGNEVYMDQGFFSGNLKYQAREESCLGTLNFVELNEHGNDIIHSVTMEFGDIPLVSEYATKELKQEVNL